MLGTPQPATRRALLAAETRQPFGPTRPPATLVLGCAGQPLIGLVAVALAGPVAALVFRSRVDHPGDMTAGTHGEAGLAAKQAARQVRGLPRHDVILARGIQKGRHGDSAEVRLDAAHGELARHAQAVLQVEIAQVPGGKRPRQIGAVGVPVEQIEGRWLAAFQVVTDDVLPDQVVGAQAGEHRSQFAAFQNPPLADGRLASCHRIFVDEAAKFSRLGKIEQRRQQRQRRHWIFAARTGHGQCRRQDRAADTEAQRIHLFHLANFTCHLERGQRTLLDVIVPAQMTEIGLGITPGHHEHGVTLFDRIADQRVFWLQVENVVLVDARWHHHQRTLRHLVGERRILDQLDQFVLIHHRAR